MAGDSEMLVREAYGAYARGDVARLLEAVDEDLEWTYLDRGQPDPRPQTCHGRKQLAQGLRRQASRGLRSEVDEIIGHGDMVFVAFRTRGAGRYRGQPASDRNYEVATVRNGRIVALRACRDRQHALEVLGLPDAAAS